MQRILTLGQESSRPDKTRLCFLLHKCVAWKEASGTKQWPKKQNFERVASSWASSSWWASSLESFAHHDLVPLLPLIGIEHSAPGPAFEELWQQLGGPSLTKQMIQRCSIFWKYQKKWSPDSLGFLDDLTMTWRNMIRNLFKTKNHEFFKMGCQQKQRVSSLRLALRFVRGLESGIWMYIFMISLGWF